MEKVMTVSNTASKPEGLDLNSVDTKTLVGVIMQLQAKVEELESKGKAKPGNAWLNEPGPNFHISEAQIAAGFWAVTDMVMDQDYKEGDIMRLTLWKPSKNAPDNAIGRLSAQPKWEGNAEDGESSEICPI